MSNEENDFDNTAVFAKEGARTQIDVRALINEHQANMRKRREKPVRRDLGLEDMPSKLIEEETTLESALRQLLPGAGVSTFRRDDQNQALVVSYDPSLASPLAKRPNVISLVKDALVAQLGGAAYGSASPGKIMDERQKEPVLGPNTPGVMVIHLSGSKPIDSINAKAFGDTLMDAARASFEENQKAAASQEGVGHHVQNTIIGANASGLKFMS